MLNVQDCCICCSSLHVVLTTTPVDLWVRFGVCMLHHVRIRCSVYVCFVTMLLLTLHRACFLFWMIEHHSMTFWGQLWGFSPSFKVLGGITRLYAEQSCRLYSALVWLQCHCGLRLRWALRVCCLVYCTCNCSLCVKAQQQVKGAEDLIRGSHNCC
jgi:hypothetical protein